MLVYKVLNWCTDSADLMLRGSLFHSVGAQTIRSGLTPSEQTKGLKKLRYKAEPDNVAI